MRKRYGQAAWCWPVLRAMHSSRPFRQSCSLQNIQSLCLHRSPQWLQTLFYPFLPWRGPPSILASLKMCRSVPRSPVGMAFRVPGCFFSSLQLVFTPPLPPYRIKDRRLLSFRRLVQLMPMDGWMDGWTGWMDDQTE